jgi:hypothetical protein
MLSVTVDSAGVTMDETHQALGPHKVDGLLEFANNVLPTLRRTDGLFCFDRTFESPQLRGQSVRYSILVLLGLLKRRSEGRALSVDVDDLHKSIVGQIDSLGVGDLSLLLWAQVRMSEPGARDTIARLAARALSESLDPLEGMEAAWFVLGTLEAFVAGLMPRPLFDGACAHLQSRRSRRSPLFRHTVSTPRRRFPNFATQIYSLLALAEVARHDLGHGANVNARALADKLIELRQPDGGWPWLFHADRGCVVEPYEIYSVHQDAMAPMALFALSEAVADKRYARAAVESFQWCFGRNELRFTFYDPANRFAHRSIKRRGSAHSFNLWANTALGGVLGLPNRVQAGGVEINRTCRPYHLGWILEAWSGRQHLHDLVAGAK